MLETFKYKHFTVGTKFYTPNWYIEELDDFLPQVDTVPALIQNEIHPYYQEQEVVAYIQSKGIVAEGWYPLGGRGRQKELLTDPVLEKIADSHGKTVAQVILRWNVQRGALQFQAQVIRNI